jgi:hypothetical protein
MFSTSHGRQQALDAVNKLYHRAYEVDLRCTDGTEDL